jgi:hypothetical protein
VSHFTKLVYVFLSLTQVNKICQTGVDNDDDDNVMMKMMMMVDLIIEG